MITATPFTTKTHSGVILDARVSAHTVKTSRVYRTPFPGEYEACDDAGNCLGTFSIEGEKINITTVEGLEVLTSHDFEFDGDFPAKLEEFPPELTNSILEAIEHRRG